ncbi:MAG: DUF4276 family protein [Neisseriaceae bacterium]|nr:DUF4276 family protein [Neisseriaceae bacterium]
MTPSNTRIIILAEGKSDVKVITEVIAPNFANSEIWLEPITMPTSIGHKGGAISLGRFLLNAMNKIKQEQNCFVTTIFDFYKLDSSFLKQGVENINNIYTRAECIEKFMSDILQEKLQQEQFDFRPERFIPYIQLHELEGLFFSDVEKLCSIEPDWKKHLLQLQAVQNNFDTPEHINNSSETAPSKRLDKILTNPKYRKTRHAPLIAKHITLEKMEAECQHFHQWLEKLRNLPKL